MNVLSEEVRKASVARDAQLLEAYTRRQVRLAVAKSRRALVSDQEANDSALEKDKRLWLMIATLEKNVKAIGGKLRFVVEFPDRPNVILSLKGRIVGSSKLPPGTPKQI
ncbi:hypothetical protein [Brevundimonas sp. R86498]|uniref:hypothetical protein n=1 Tax=Brevundimonas sp. R86498 TaxID=3093845 RepID=UPI0037C950C8